MKTGFLTRLATILAMFGVVVGFDHAVLAAGNLEAGFAAPPADARPWVYWFWLNGNITSNGITADLEAMQRVGIGGVLIMEVDQGTPKGPAAFGGPEWRALFHFACQEAHRLGLQINMNNDAGWCGSGGPWITPDLAMQKVVWSETNVVGPAHFDADLAQPPTVDGFYRDIAVLAFPTPKQEARIEDIQGKAAFVPERIAPQATWPALPADATIARDGVVNLTRLLATNGHLAWEVPAGNWTILRFGHTPTGKDNHPAPEAGRGLECDKLSKQGIEAMFNGLMGKLIADAGPLAGKTLVSTHIDSWEVGSQNWTANFREEFEQRRGYDPLKFLPVLTGRVVGSEEISERFLWDLRQTVSDLLVENYAGHLRELAHEHGLRLSIEAYDGTPCDDMSYAGQADEPMAEFWSRGYNAAYSCTEMASAAHVYGKRILGAEAFTANADEKWLLYPAAIKALGDWAFCEGINRFVFHRYALQPWQREYQPGMSMGPWGLHYERTETWWEQSAAWHEYLARCQFMLRQGLFVADICYLEPEGSPQRFTVHFPGQNDNTPDRPKYNFDGCSPEVVLTRMKVKDGRLVLPDGMSYRVLVLPEVKTMTPALLRRIKELVAAGATVIGAPPLKSPSLSDYPKCDEEVKQLAEQLWEHTNPGADFADRPAPFAEHAFGKGRVVWDPTSMTAQAANPLATAKWIWYPEGHPAQSAPAGKRFFRRRINLESNQAIVSARMAMTADNAFQLRVNGQLAGAGDNWSELYTLDVTRLLKPGTNFLAVAAENTTDSPSPAGLIGSLFIQFANGRTLRLDTDSQWESARSNAGSWTPAMELGAAGMAPWNVPGGAGPEYKFPSFDLIAGVLGRLGVPPDFEADAKLRYIHRQADSMDIYFVANPETNWVGATCAFRVSGKVPEIWNPMTGQITRQPVYQEKDGRTFLPLWLEPVGSAFVVFKETNSAARRIVAATRDGRSILPQPGQPLVEAPVAEVTADAGGQISLLASQPGNYELQTASGGTRLFKVDDLSAPLALSGPWEVHFQPQRGAPEQATFDTLTDWSKSPDAGIKYFSGTATYQKSFTLPPEMLTVNRRLYLDLGNVAVSAEVELNGKNLGVLWKPPFRVEVTDFVKVGVNALQVKVVNLWVNRMIGDEDLPEDSARNADGTLKEWPAWLLQNQPSPTGRITFTTWRLWQRGSPLQESGLLGPVRLVPVKELKWVE